MAAGLGWTRDLMSGGLVSVCRRMLSGSYCYYQGLGRDFFFCLSVWLAAVGLMSGWGDDDDRRAREGGRIRKSRHQLRLEFRDGFVRSNEWFEKMQGARDVQGFGRGLASGACFAFARSLACLIKVFITSHRAPRG